MPWRRSRQSGMPIWPPAVFPSRLQTMPTGSWRSGKSMLDSLKQLASGGDRFRVRIGVHTGPVIAGLIGRHRFVYDVWGETVNIASRLESQGVADRMQISEATRRALRTSWALEPRSTSN